MLQSGHRRLRGGGGGSGGSTRFDKSVESVLNSTSVSCCVGRSFRVSLQLDGVCRVGCQRLLLLFVANP